MKGIIKKNAQAITQELDWLAEVIDTSLKLHFGQQTKYKSIYDIQAPDMTLDEAYLDVTEDKLGIGSAIDIAQSI
ncbi:MAG: hypothetical protein EOP55_17405, partial [Sphingobacteriales bacterium]